jgi:hypothetical protein
MMDVRFRPYATWPHGNTLIRRSRHTFKAAWPATLELLDRELRHLGARDVVIGAALREQDIRLDGWPRADARTPWHPGIEVSFDVIDRNWSATAVVPRRYVRLVYSTDECAFWQHNVRSIALGLEALRAVDRYGITKRGQQYAGWRALPASAGTTLTPTRDKGVHLIELHGGVRAALRATHLDRGGDPVEFQSVQMARES